MKGFSIIFFFLMNFFLFIFRENLTIELIEILEIKHNELESQIQLQNIVKGNFLTEIAAKIIWFRKNILLVSFFFY